MAIDPEWTQEALDEIDYDPTMREFDRVLRKEVSDVKKAILERAKARKRRSDGTHYREGLRPMVG